MTTPMYSSLLDRALAGMKGAEPDDHIRDRIIAAAREQFRLTGIRRTSMEGVARRAHTSRITVYRRFATKEALVDQVLLGELQAFFVQFRAVVRRAPSAEERLVEGFALSLREARENPLAGGLLATEPEVMIPLLVADGRVLHAVSDFVAGQLQHEQSRGELPAAVDVRMVAELVARFTLSFFLNPRSCLDLDDPRALRRVARQFLAPLLRAGVDQ